MMSHEARPASTSNVIPTAAAPHERGLGVHEGGKLLKRTSGINHGGTIP